MRTDLNNGLAGTEGTPRIYPVGRLNPEGPAERRNRSFELVHVSGVGALILILKTPRSLFTGTGQEGRRL